MVIINGLSEGSLIQKLNKIFIIFIVFSFCTLFSIEITDTTIIKTIIE